jgi:hypothetical protein
VIDNYQITVDSAKKLISPLLFLNAIFLTLVIGSFLAGSAQTAIYFATFYLIELLLFIVFFIPVFFYQIVKGRGLKYSLSKGMLSFGDFYHYISPW